MYIKPRIQDFFYFQTGMEIDEFNHSVVRLDMEEDKEFKQIVRDYTQIIKQLYDAIGLPYDDVLSDEDEVKLDEKDQIEQEI